MKPFCSSHSSSLHLSPLTFRAVVSRPAALDGPADARVAIHAWFALAFVHPPKALTRTEVTADTVFEIDAQRRTCFDCFVQNVTDGLMQFVSPRF